MTSGLLVSIMEVGMTETTVQKKARVRFRENFRPLWSNHRLKSFSSFKGEKQPITTKTGMKVWRWQCEYVGDTGEIELDTYGRRKKTTRSIEATGAASTKKGAQDAIEIIMQKMEHRKNEYYRKREEAAERALNYEEEKKLGEVIAEFMQRKEKLSEKTLEGYARTLNDFMDWYGDYQTVSSISRKVLLDYRRKLEDEGNLKYGMKQEKKKSNATMNSIFRTLKAFMNYAVYEDYIVKSPFLGFKDIWLKAESYTGHKQYLNEEEVKKMKQLMKGHKLEDIFLFQLWTGCRIGETLEILKSDVSLTEKRITLRAEITKAHKTRFVYLDREELFDLVTRLIKSNDNIDLLFPYYYTGDHQKQVIALSQAFTRKFKQADLPYTGTHVLRHTFATELYRESKDLLVVMDRLGHSSITVTQAHYTHLDEQYAREQVLKMKH